MQINWNERLSLFIIRKHKTLKSSFSIFYDFKTNNFIFLSLVWSGRAFSISRSTQLSVKKWKFWKSSRIVEKVKKSVNIFTCVSVRVCNHWNCMCQKLRSHENWSHCRQQLKSGLEFIVNASKLFLSIWFRDISWMNTHPTWFWCVFIQITKKKCLCFLLMEKAVLSIFKSKSKAIRNKDI